MAEFNFFGKHTISRQSIGKDIKYTDLHTKNVMICIKEMKINYIDPGKPQPYSEAWKEWLLI